MEFFVFIAIILAAIVLILAFRDNDSPVTDWSDYKLDREYKRCSHFGTSYAQIGRYEIANDRLKKAKEIKEEIERRRQGGFNREFAETARFFAEKSVNLLQKTMAEHACSEEHAMKIISTKINTLTEHYIAQGLNEDEANEKALQEILGIMS